LRSIISLLLVWAAIDKFGEAIIIAAHILLLKEVGKRGGLDYLQVFDIDG